MGGVEVMDRLLSSYRPTLGGRNWWWPLFINAVNITVVAAWRVYTQLQQVNHMSHIDFGREIAVCLLKISAAS
jgi:hypothetical protein